MHCLFWPKPAGGGRVFHCGDINLKGKAGGDTQGFIKLPPWSAVGTVGALASRDGADPLLTQTPR